MTRVLLATAILLTGCVGGASGALVTKTIRHDGLDRTYHVYAPPQHKRSREVPLVLALHGGGGQGLRFDASTNGQMKKQADARGWVLVYPEGIKKGWNDGRKIETPRDAARADVDDVGFMAALIQQMRKDFGIDTKRVYATGISNGGFMSMRLAIDIPGEIRAIGSVTAQLGKHLENEKPSQPVGVLIMNGTDDPLVPYDGGQVRVLGRDRGEILSTDDSIKWWLEKNGCEDEKLETAIPNRDEEDGTTTTVTKYPNCAAGTAVVLYRVSGGGHTWPGGMQYLPKKTIGNASRDFDAAEHIFDFFSTQR